MARSSSGHRIGLWTLAMPCAESFMAPSSAGSMASLLGLSAAAWVDQLASDLVVSSVPFLLAGSSFLWINESRRTSLLEDSFQQPLVALLVWRWGLPFAIGLSGYQGLVSSPWWLHHCLSG